LGEREVHSNFIAKDTGKENKNERSDLKCLKTKKPDLMMVSDHFNRFFWGFKLH